MVTHVINRSVNICGGGVKGQPKNPDTGLWTWLETAQNRTSTPSAWQHIMSFQY